MINIVKLPLWASLKRHNVMKQTREPPQQRFDGS
jgi:hypothetical protein